MEAPESSQPLSQAAKLELAQRVLGYSFKDTELLSGAITVTTVVSMVSITMLMILFTAMM